MNLAGSTKCALCKNKNEVHYEKNKASAYAEITYKFSGEENKSNANFQYICIDKKWYISDLDFE